MARPRVRSGRSSTDRPPPLFAGRMSAQVTPVLPPRHGLLERERAATESQCNSRSQPSGVLVGSWADPVPIRREHLQLQSEGTASLGHEPTPPTQSAVVVTHHRFRQVDGEQGVASRAWSSRVDRGMRNLASEAALTLGRIARLHVRHESGALAAQQPLQSTENPADSLSPTVLPLSVSRFESLDQPLASSPLLGSTTDRRNPHRNHALALVIDEHRHRHGLNGTPLERLHLV